MLPLTSVCRGQQAVFCWTLDGCPEWAGAQLQGLGRGGRGEQRLLMGVGSPCMVTRWSSGTRERWRSRSPRVTCSGGSCSSLVMGGPGEFSPRAPRD